MSRYIVLLIAIAFLIFTGCSNQQFKNINQQEIKKPTCQFKAQLIDKENAINIANSHARKIGYDLSKYQKPKIEKDNMNCSWYLSFEEKYEVDPITGYSIEKLGGHFSISIDWESGEIYLFRGA